MLLCKAVNVSRSIIDCEIKEINNSDFLLYAIININDVFTEEKGIINRL